MSTDHLMGVYNRAPLEVDRGQGARLWGKDGTEYLDCVMGISTNALGHANPILVQAVKDQAEKLWHVSNIFKIPGQEALADALCEKSFADVVFFTNSGTEAVECAIKTARKYHSSAGNAERIDIYGFDGSFHGRTYGAINAAANPSYTNGFGPPMEGFHQLVWGDREALTAAFQNPNTAAIILEPVQGEGGCRATPDEDLRWMRQMADDNGVLIIFDEVQCGMGRTGKLWAHEWAGMTPDIMAIAKALGGGFPIGACLATTKAASVVARQAPTGKPPPRALATAMMSGAMPAHSWAHSLPVRPMPHWTSSKMISTPVSSAIWRIQRRSSSGVARQPPSPCTGSRMIAAVLGFWKAAVRASRSPQTSWWKPSIGGPKPLV